MYFNSTTSYQSLMNYWNPGIMYTAPVRYILNTQDLYGRRYLSKAEVDFKAMNRLLWEEHVNWTRMTIISIVFNLPDLEICTKATIEKCNGLWGIACDLFMVIKLQISIRHLLRNI